MIAEFDRKVIEMIGSHPSIIVGTCDRACVPGIARAFGARIIPGRASIDVFVSGWPGPNTLANIQQNNRVAVTFTSPETFEAYQIKGRAVAWGECTAEDHDLSRVFTETIRQRIAALHEPPELVRVTFTARGLFRITVDAESVFVQNPGKNAGQKL
jgi:hypothetical protein